MDIPYYADFLSEELVARLDASSQEVIAVPGLKVAPGLRDEFPDIETDDALAFVVELYERVKPRLNGVLKQRSQDREFIDRHTSSFQDHNSEIDFHSAKYRTVIGLKDEAGRVVIGPLDAPLQNLPVDVPGFMAGTQVTLFGPPDTAKLSINAMNAVHRIPIDEPEIVTRIVDTSGEVARWGADNEDSKTPIMRSFLQACRNVVGCFDGTISFEEPERDRVYELASERLSKPIKRFPGLAIPDGSHILNGSPLPLHLYDFAMHMFHNWDKPEALVFYVPKLENEEEATYVHEMVATAENMLQARHESYQIGQVRLMVVYENPRAIFRIQEIAEALHPYFLGGSLGWHDFLASTARVFKNDPRYRIPVKADPNIVINHIKESHGLLVEKLSPIGGLKIGGMYGVLFEDGNLDSYHVSKVGFVKDVVTQLKRGLDGFWVAHPDFVRTGIALVKAFEDRRRGNTDTLRDVVRALIPDDAEFDPLMEFIEGPDVPGLDKSDPLYARAVLAATLEKSDVIANDDPEEVRYNIFQAVQYLADWLCGNGCVALPATMTNQLGEAVNVRVMDDLATTERSRWELWAEVAHNRVSVELFDEILREELDFIRAGIDKPGHVVAVRWEGEAAKWYPIAGKILRELVVTETPVEFATQLLLPYTFDVVRDAVESPHSSIGFSGTSSEATG